MKISDIPINLRPREKALQYGIEELSDQELLALIIGSGGRGNSALDIAGSLLVSHVNSMESLSKTDYISLLSYSGLKKSIALRLLATFEFHNRLAKNRYQEIVKINDEKDVYFRYKYFENFEQEVMVLVMLDIKKRFIKEKILYKGTSDSFSLDVKEVIRELILANAKFYYLLHNHPDEESEASKEDILTTKIVENASKHFGIKLLNHLVVYKGGFSLVKTGFKTY